MEEANRNQKNEGGMKRPPFVGLIAFLMGVLIGIFIPLSKALRKMEKKEK